MRTELGSKTMKLQEQAVPSITRSPGSPYVCQAVDFSSVMEERLGEVFFFSF